ncbi:AUGMIN subunit 6-like isoform X1 [Musa acuminata AAA Group]|uniref:AUGMIN subunit 6-like isoform X1 n=1 Tax=Musa acuminata AAA Group TaxID=214697 RepID=UPI0031DFD236
MATEREKEREAELESAMYTNCLLLGLDPAIIGGGGSPRVGHFRHSNPRLGEQLLYFLLSALRGPAQSAKDFDKVWPIFDSAQSREFRKIVQGIISELESQGALPRSNSRVSSLATCCGPRFVELLWQLSVHALREVHKRTFAADVASNPLPASLTDVSYLHAAALLPVTKQARIALERRRFLKNANIAVHRQAAWSNLAHEMTAEFRGLCAEEAYLQQELEKLQDMKNKAKLEGDMWDDRISSSSNQNSHLVSKATRLWESLLARQSQHEVLASGPIEDLIAHREHRYRISGSSLLAAMDLNSHTSSPGLDTREKRDSSQFQEQSDDLSRMDDQGGGVYPTVDVAEILRRWTHALQRIHKQLLNLVKANEGEGPELLRSASDSSSSGHVESLAATLAEHRQHLVSIQGLVDQLKEVIPAMQMSISDLTEEVNNISSTMVDGFSVQSSTTVQYQSAGRQLERLTDEVAEMTSKFSSAQIEKVSSSPTLKLPHLFNLTPNSLGKGNQAPKQHPVGSQTNQETLSAPKTVSPPVTIDEDGEAQETDDYYAHNIRRSVREAALSSSSSNSELLQERSSDDGSEHFFIPLSTTDAASQKEIDYVPNWRNQQLVFSSPREVQAPMNMTDLSCNANSQQSFIPDMLNKLNGLKENKNLARLFQPSTEKIQRTHPEVNDTLDQVFSPPLLLESSFFQDAYEDLLAPLSETDAALMEH